MKRVLIVLTFASVLIPVTSVLAVTPTTCALIKQKATAKKAAGEFNCYSKAVKGGIPVDITCLLAASSKFLGVYVKTEARGGCNPANIGDGVLREPEVDSFVASIVAAESTTGCSAIGDPCGMTCGGTGSCQQQCSLGELDCIRNDSSAIPSACTSDLDCQAVNPGSVCVALGAGCTGHVCALPCP
jgi:hypothetical protein